MQGTLKEIDLWSILKLIELGQRTGELLIQSYTGASWFIFFLNGDIVYATSTETQRLKQYLRALELDLALNQVNPSNFSFNLLEYGQIWAFLESGALTPNQAINILTKMVYEVLTDLISLSEANFTFNQAITLSPQLINIKFDLISEHITKQSQQWKQLYQFIQSPDQCPTIIDPNLLANLHLSDSPSNAIFKWIDGKTSIRQIARYLNQSTLEIADIIFRQIEQGNLAISPAGLPVNQQQSSTSLRIACIDDSITICRAVEYILQTNGYQVTSISNPIRALSLVFQLKPNLILCDIAMPELNGYELCAMFRKSVAFSQIPIIMLTGKDGYIDRIKARMVGATEYLTKPFREKELLTVVERCLLPSYYKNTAN